MINFSRFVVHKLKFITDNWHKLWAPSQGPFGSASDWPPFTVVRPVQIARTAR